MPKEKYTLILSDTLDTGKNYSDHTFYYDLKSLLPLNLNGKKFTVQSSFHTLEPMGSTAYGCFSVFLEPAEYTLRYNRSADTSVFPDRYLPLGVAKPIQCGATSYIYGYTASDCNEFTVDYPKNDTTIKIKVSNLKENIDDDYAFMLVLTFTEA